MMVLALVGGLAALIGGAEVVVKYGSNLARRLRISPMIIGLTVVSIGTSAPELAVGIDGMVRGAPSLVLGNIAGSNIANVLLILGIAAVLKPIAVRGDSLRLDLPVMVGVSLLAWLLVADGTVTTIEGTVLLAVAAGYLWRLVATARSRTTTDQLVVEEEDHSPNRGTGWLVLDLALVAVGIAVIVLGADWLVTGAVGLAEHFGVSEAIIGLTVGAIGTSAPELATTVMGTLRGQQDLALGTILGSNIMNLSLILGGSLLFGPASVGVDPHITTIDLPVMTAVALACIPVFLTGRRISRLEGVLYLVAYVAYLGLLLATRA